jgi:cytochrome P450
MLTARWPLGHALALRRDPLGFLRAAAASGDVVPLQIGRERWCLVVHPADVASVLAAPGAVKPAAIRVAGRLVFGGALTALDGEPWARRRRTVAAAFHRAAAGLRGAPLAATLDRALDGWSAGDGDRLPALRALVLTALGATVLGEPAIDAGRVGAAIEGALAGYHQRVMLGVPVPDWLPAAGNPAMRRGMRVVADVVDRAIAARRAAPGGDLASRLLAEPTLDEAAVRDELAVSFALGGHQTTVALAWALALVAAHPAVAAAASASDIVDEALRLYPPFYLLARHAAEPIALRGAPIPAGTTVLVSPYLAHRDPRSFADPDTFAPARWRNRPSPGAYLPFGAGPRACVAQSLTRALLIAALDVIRARFELHITTMPAAAPAISLAPRDLRLELRAP